MDVGHFGLGVCLGFDLLPRAPKPGIPTMDTDDNVDGMRQRADSSPSEDYFLSRVIRPTSHFPQQTMPATIEAFQQQFLPGRRVLLPAPPRAQNNHSAREIVAAQALLTLWKDHFVSQAPQPDQNPPPTTPPTVFYAGGRPLIPERREFESMSELIQLLQ